MLFRVQLELFQCEMRKVCLLLPIHTASHIRIIAGELSMQKVKVHRYVSGKKPDYAQDARSDSESDEDDFLERRNHVPTAPSPEPVASEDEMNDPRLRRLKEVETEVRPERRRHVLEPEILESSEDEQTEEDFNLSGKVL